MNVEFQSIPNQLPYFSIALYALTILNFLVLSLYVFGTTLLNSVHQ